MLTFEWERVEEFLSLLGHLHGSYVKFSTFYSKIRDVYILRNT